jgi:hypothetical protein
MQLTLQAGDQFRNGFSGSFRGNWSTGRSRQETARFPGEPTATPTAAPRPSSHAFCVGTLDLASVSNNVRSVSDSVRRTGASVSANLRRKPPLIARRAGYDCAPLHVAGRAGCSDLLHDGQDVDRERVCGPLDGLPPLLPRFRKIGPVAQQRTLRLLLRQRRLGPDRDQAPFLFSQASRD